VRNIPDVLAMSDEFYLPDAKTVRPIIQMKARRFCPSWSGQYRAPFRELPKPRNGLSERAIFMPSTPPCCSQGPFDAAQAQRITDAAEIKKLLQEARSLLEKSRGKGEDSATIYTELGALYYKLAMWEKAAENYEKALRMRRRRNDLRFSLGQSYAQLGKINEAEQKYREILSLSSDDTDALKALQDLGKPY
jgi:tetratricopeptide (TPR) repeat protein